MRPRSSFTPSGVLSISTRVALHTIKQRYRNDKFSVETNGNQIRLLRQSRPLTANFFLDLHYMPDECLIVGILTPLEKDGTCEAQIILDPYGRPVWEPRCFVTVKTYKGRVTAASLSKQFQQQRKQRIESEDERKLEHSEFWDRLIDCASCSLCCEGRRWID